MVCDSSEIISRLSGLETLRCYVVLFQGVVNWIVPRSLHILMSSMLFTVKYIRELVQWRKHLEKVEHFIKKKGNKLPLSASPQKRRRRVPKCQRFSRWFERAWRPRKKTSRWHFHENPSPKRETWRRWGENTNRWKWGESSPGKTGEWKPWWKD